MKKQDCVRSTAPRTTASLPLDASAGRESLLRRHADISGPSGDRRERKTSAVAKKKQENRSSWRVLGSPNAAKRREDGFGDKTPLTTAIASSAVHQSLGSQGKPGKTPQSVETGGKLTMLPGFMLPSCPTLPCRSPIWFAHSRRHP